MAITPGATTSNGGISPGSTITFSHTVETGNNRFLVVQFGWSGLATAITSVKYNSVSMTLIATKSQTDPFGGSLVSSMWGLIAPDTGAHNVEIILNNNPGKAVWAATSWLGVDQATPTGAAVTATMTSNPNISVNVSSAAGEVVIDAVYGYQPTATKGSSQTLLFSTTTSDNQGGGSYQPGATTVTMSWTGFTGGFGDTARLVAVPLKPAIVVLPSRIVYICG